MTMDAPNAPADPSASQAMAGTCSPTNSALDWADPPVVRRPSLARRVVSIATTLLAVTCAALGSLLIWNYYVVAPWTRDGRVRVQVASVAPQVSGQIAQVHIVDNQFVKAGDVLYVIDAFDYRTQLASAKAAVRQAAADYQAKRAHADRLLKLSSLAATPEQQQIAVAAADMAAAAFDQAQHRQQQAEIDLQRTAVKSPVDGFVTNLLMRIGDYAQAGRANVSVVDTSSYWIDGYFEETKLGQVCIGDRAEAKLMGFAMPIIGEVETVTRGISVSNATPSTQGLPSVDAVYTWVRLAQRVPVRIRITEVPSGVPLISGLTATVSLLKTAETSEYGALGALFTGLRDVLSPAPVSPSCVPALMGGRGADVRLPEPQTSPLQTPEEIEPGLVPGLTSRPKTP